MPERSLILTGAPGTGKSTIYRELLDKNFDASPPHMTRERRDGEIDGIDAVFIARGIFQRNLADGLYFEKTEYQALFEANNQYYGCPEAWTEEITVEGRRLAVVPTSLFAAECLARSIKSDGDHPPIDWVHLYASEDTVVKRMKGRRSESEEEIRARLRHGDTHNLPPEELSRIVDTDDLSARDVLELILKVTNRR